MDSTRALLSEYHKEELEDMKKYCDLAEKLKDTDPKISGVLKDISKEEKTHAHLIEYLLSE